MAVVRCLVLALLFLFPIPTVAQEATDQPLPSPEPTPVSPAPVTAATSDQLRQLVGQVLAASHVADGVQWQLVDRAGSQIIVVFQHEQNPEGWTGSLDAIQVVLPDSREILFGTLPDPYEEYVVFGSRDGQSAIHYCGFATSQQIDEIQELVRLFVDLQTRQGADATEADNAFTERLSSWAFGLHCNPECHILLEKVQNRGEEPPQS